MGVILLSSGLFSKAQNSQFSQFYSSPTILAPSFAGITGNSRIVMNFRDQWPSVPGTFLTYAASFDHYLPKLNSGIGILAYRDQAGDGNLASTKFGAQYAYNVKLNRKWSLRPGIMFAYQQTSIDFQNLVFGDAISIDGIRSPTAIQAPSILESRGFIDFSASFLAVHPNLWIGATVDHLLTPNESLANEIETPIPMKFSVYGGYKFLVSNNRRQRLKENVIVSFLYKNQARTDQFDIGAYWNKDPISLGLWVRGLPGFMQFIQPPATVHGSQRYGNLDALVVLVGYKLGQLRVGYSYDFTISDLIGNTGGAHEVSLIYEFKSNLRIKNRKRRESIPCPTF